MWVRFKLACFGWPFHAPVTRWFSDGGGERRCIRCGKLFWYADGDADPHR